jgi:predicted PurR-regulated permease PerM
MPTKPIAFSYAFLFLILVLAAWLRLTTPFVTILFSYFALRKLCFLGQRWIAVSLFIVLVSIIFSGFVFFLRKAFVALPDIVATVVPLVVQFADKHGIELPFTDVQGLKDVALESVRSTLGYLGNFAKIATKEFVFLLIGVVVAVAMFLAQREDRPGDAGANLYDFYTGLIRERFRSFYRSFETVMGAQLLISLINTVFTSVFVIGCSLRHASVVIALTFLCGLLPIIGNLISNLVIVGIAFTVSPQLAIGALVFLVTIHKLEYFLNSKIVGHRIKHPMWLTLVALVFGERLMGIPGMILAPVILSFIKIEASRYPAAPVPQPDGAGR